MRKIRDERDARECLSKVRASRLPLGEWARKHGIDGRSLTIWKLNLGRRGKGQVPTTRKAKPRFVEIVAQPAVRGRYTVVVGEVRIEVDDAFRSETLARLLAVARSC